MPEACSLLGPSWLPAILSDSRSLNAPRCLRSYRGDSYEAFNNNLLGQQTGNGQPIGTEYTTVADFGRFIRVLVEIDDTGTVEFGVMSLSLALRFHS